VRYFRSAPEVYALVGSRLDQAYGYPNKETQTDRTLPVAADLPSDSNGRVYLAVDAVYCGYILPSQMLAQLLASGAVEEIDESTYMQFLPQIT